MTGNMASYAYVVFVQSSNLRYLRWIRGFKHCYVALDFGPRLLILNPMEARTEAVIFEGGLYWPKVLAELSPGTTVLKVPICEARGFSFGIFSCVELVKRVIGIKNWRIITPRQLYRRILLDFPEGSEYK